MTGDLVDRVRAVVETAWPTLDAAGIDAFPDRVEAALRAARLAERDPRLIDTSARLPAFARRPE